jgi:phage terminase large subunit GpA-like protein
MLERLYWLPEEPRGFTLTAPIAAADWVAKNVTIPRRDSAVPGPVDLNLTPYLRGIYDALDDPMIDTITAIFGTQLGKTFFLYSSMMCLTVQRPGPMLLVMPTEPDAREIAGGQLLDYVRCCQAAWDHVVGGEKGLTLDGFTFARSSWYFGWSNSARSPVRRPEVKPPEAGRRAIANVPQYDRRQVNSGHIAHGAVQCRGAGMAQ